MAASGFTPIQLYRTATASTSPTSGNLAVGELAINYNTADMSVWALNTGGSVIRLMNNPAGLKYPTTDGTANQVMVTNGSGVLSWAAGPSGTYLPLAGGTMTGNLTLDAYTEKVATLATSGSIALNPSTGTTLSCAAAGTVTFTDSLSSGQSISLLLTNGSTYTINWPTTTWVTAAGNTAPTLSASNTLVFWKISSTLYGALVGKSA
jgi:hypothetical protein